MSEEKIKKVKAAKPAVKKTTPTKKTAGTTPKKKTATVTKKAAPVKPVKKTAEVKPKKTVVKKTPEPSAAKKPAKPVSELPDVILKSAQFLDDKKAENLVLLDLRFMANGYDYFLVATAANSPHLKSLSDGLQRLFKNEQYKGYRAAGTGDSGWIIVDYYGVMIHVFSAEMRALYDLEKLWKDAKRPKLPLNG
ncbi:MAG: ribosome silencing factor [Kiritimatiellaceae bacterium]|nr:ribosome silencing factor [Kiritimatiellaceae bacterium]